MTIEFEIKYDRITKDYRCMVDGRCVGYRATYTAGDTLCRQVVADLIADGLAYTAAEPDPPPVDDPLPEQPGEPYPGVDYEEERNTVLA